MKGVIFDLDGVLTDTAKFHFLAWKKLAKEEFNLDLPNDFENNLKGLSRIDSLKKILSLNNLMLDDNSLKKAAEKKNSYYLKAIKNLSSNDILPGIKDLILDLNKRKIMLSVASASKNAPVILKKLGLFNYFSVIVNPNEINTGKPAPDIYLKALEKMNLSASDCIGVEDAISGVLAIKASKMTAVAVGDYKELRKAQCVVPRTCDFNYQLFYDVWERYHLKN